MTEYQSVFKGPEAEAAFMAAYDRALEKWPVPYETKYLSTAFGETHVIVSGREDGEPLILIHGVASSATSWYASVATLAPTCRVYALDTIGELGRSKVAKALSDRGELAEWLTGVLDALGIEKAYMAGWSMGGFFAACYALQKPERLKKIVLIAPAATFAPFGKGFLLEASLRPTVAELASDVYRARRAGSYAIEWMRENFLRISKQELVESIKDHDLAELLSIFGEESLEELAGKIDSVLRSCYEYMFAPGNLVENEFLDHMLVGRKSGKQILGFGPYPLPDEELKRLSLPTLLIVGEHEILYEADPDQVLKRAEELVKDIRTALIPNASHFVPWEQPELVNSHILKFLSGDE
jgi:pimeloyl-ACP methyl ester carboxylesterase